MSSRSWNASPSGSAVGRQRRCEVTEPPCECRAEVQRTLDGVLPRLVPGDALGGDAVRLPARSADDVEVLADVELDAQLVPHRHRLGVRCRQELIGVDEREVSHEDRDALTEPSRFAAPVAHRVPGRVLEMRGAHATTSRRAVHDVVVDQREGVQQLERRARICDYGIVGIAAGTDETPVAERRPEALASREEERAERLERRHDLWVEGTPPLGLGLEEGAQPLLDSLCDHREARGRAAHRSEPRARRSRPSRRAG